MEYVGIGGCCYALYRVINNDRIQLKKEWELAMDGSGLRTKEEGKKKKSTFELTDIKKKDYGFKVKIKIPYGLSFSALEEKTEVIENNLKCLLEMRKPRLKNIITARIITQPLTDFRFMKKVCEPYELYFGDTHYHMPIISSFKVYPHLLLTGTTNMGKTCGLKTAMLNLILQYDDTKVQFYISQLSKADYRVFQDCVNTKAYATGLDESVAMLQEIEKIMDLREKLIDKSRTENIYDYLKKHPEEILPFIYIIFEEYAFFMPDKADSDGDKDKKEYCNAIIKRVLAAGRASGLYVCLSLQRASADNISSSLKALCLTKISYKQVNVFSARVALDNDMAVNLEPKEGIMNTDEYYYYRTPFVNNDVIRSLLRTKEHKIVNKTSFTGTFIENHEPFTGRPKGKGKSDGKL